LSLIQELKRRNVIRVGVLYLVATWLLLQLTDVLSSLLPVPESTGSLVFLLLVLGFIPVVIFAWVYEMTPDGLKREVDVDRSQSVVQDTGKKINTVIVVLLVLAIGGLVADRLIPELSDDTKGANDVPIEVAEESLPANELVDDRSIAVLPFADLSPGQDQRYFIDGLSEELLNLLVRVDELRVASRTSSFAYRGSTLGIPEISRALKVGHILEGSVRKDGDRIRITAQLIEAGTDTHVWSENFDSEFVDIFAIQDEIANAIVNALTGELGMDGEKAVTVEVATENVGAYELYLTARELFIRRDQLSESIRLFREAIELDPNFARAWEGLAAVEAIIYDYVYDGIDHFPLAKEAAETAISLNPDSSLALAVLGSLASDREYDLLRAAEYYDAAIEKDPNIASTWLWIGLDLMTVGYLDDAMAAFEKCIDIDPGYQNCRQHLSRAHMYIGDMETAHRIHDETLEHLFYAGSMALVSDYVRSGHRNLALLIADISLGSDGAPVIEWIRAIENPDGDHSAGFARLKDWEARTDTGRTIATEPILLLTFRAYDEMATEPLLARFALWHPDGDEFRTTPQFKAIIRKVGVYEYWQTRGFPPQCKPVGDDDFECGRP
jgi:TolB-like protein/tetratricopeptide (TPR) repeat protein